MNQVVLNKKVGIERWIAQARKYYAMKGELPFKGDHLKQDAVALNVQRACELCIDVANHLIKTRKLGLPQDSKESFSLLQRAGLIDEAMAAALRARAATNGNQMPLRTNVGLQRTNPCAGPSFQSEAAKAMLANAKRSSSRCSTTSTMMARSSI